MNVYENIAPWVVADGGGFYNYIVLKESGPIDSREKIKKDDEDSYEVAILKLLDKVNTAIKIGFKPQGGVSVVSHFDRIYVSQAMVMAEAKHDVVQHFIDNDWFGYSE